MNATTPPDVGRLQRLDVAADWLQRLHGAAPDEGLLDEWLDWCQRDPRNQQAFDELAGIWQASGTLGDELQPAPVQAAAAPDRTRRFALAASLAGLGFAVVSGGAWWLNRPEPVPVVVREFASPVGVNSTQTLPDGSVLELGGGTRATVSFAPDARRVELHAGEVFVVVHKDAARPFSVEAGRLMVIATGTEFNVLRTDERTTVTVAEGSVDALYEGQSEETPNVSLQPSQQLVYSHATRRVVVRQTDPLEVIAWRSGTLNFEKEPLSEVIVKMNRYSAKPILIDDARVARLAFTGTARADHLEGWLRGLPHVFPVTVRQLQDGRHLIGLRTGAD